MAVRIRAASTDDAETLAGLIRELAEYERLADEADPDAGALSKHLGGGEGLRLEALVAEDEETGQAVGFALYFFNYSTFLTQWGIYLEDLFVVPERRSEGVGFGLLKEVARIAADHGCRRLDWAVLDWNEPAIAFYERLGAKAMDDWTTMRLEEAAIRKLAAD